MKRHLRLTTVLAAAGLAVAVLAGCAAPSYTYAADTADHAYFKVPSSWPQVSTTALSAEQKADLAQSAAGPLGGAFAWSRAYSGATAARGTLLAGSQTPVVYSSVQNLSSGLRGALSLDQMQDLIFPVTSEGRQQAAAAGDQISGFQQGPVKTISLPGGIHGINEVYAFNVNGMPDAFDQTVLTNTDTTKLYLLLVQCYESCFESHATQINAVVNSYTVRGS